MIRRVLTYPQDKRTLRTPCQVVTRDDNLREVLTDLMDTLKANPYALGLSAPQIGSLLRVFVVRNGAEIMGFVNPAIVQTGPDMETADEGCLSLPGCHARVTRATWIRLVKQQGIGGTVMATAQGHHARVVQHELDHLDGIICIMREAHQ